MWHVARYFGHLAEVTPSKSALSSGSDTSSCAGLSISSPGLATKKVALSVAGDVLANGDTLGFQPLAGQDPPETNYTVPVQPSRKVGGRHSVDVDCLVSHLCRLLTQLATP